jgi:hypothetical protein
MAAKRIKAAQGQAVTGIKSNGTRGGGGRVRGLNALGAITGDSLTNTQIRRANRSSGLRMAAANTLTISIVERATRSRPTIGVTIRMKASKMPADQRNLPKYMNRGHWFHPTFGRPDSGTNQFVTPSGWFDTTAEAMRGRAVAAIDAAFTKAINSI